jgi:hypothetical protein
MHGTAYLHHTLLTVTDEQPQPLRCDQQQPAGRAGTRCQGEMGHGMFVAQGAVVGFHSCHGVR